MLTACIGLLYSNTYKAPFLFDDTQNITENPFLVMDELSWDSLRSAALSGPNSRRVLPNGSFALHHYFHGYDPLGYHLVNTIIHIAVAFALYLLAHLTLSLPSLKMRPRTAAEIAFLASLLWAVHPLQTNAVTYIVQRMTSMAALFYLLAFYCYVRARLQEALSAKIILFALTGALGIMALFSKENSGMLPFAIMAYELLLLRPNTRLFRTRKALLLAGAAILVFAVITWLFLGSSPLASILGGYEGRGFTLLQRVLTQPRIILHYLSLLVLPLPSRLSLMYEFQVSTTLLTPFQTLPAIVLLSTLALLVFQFGRQARLLAFAICWLLLNLLVESSVIPLELIFEHRMYLPAMFLFPAGVVWLYTLAVSRPMLIRAVLVLTVALLSAATWQRNRVWDNRITLWNDVVTKAPDSMRGWGNLGNAYGDAKKYTIAESCLRRALTLADDKKPGNISLKKKKRLTAAIHDNLALVYRETGRYDKALEHANISLAINPSRPSPLVTLGITYSKIGEDARAIEFFEQAWAQGMRNVDVYNNWAVSAFNLGKVDLAISLLQKGLRLNPDHPETHYNLGIAYSSKGMLQEARQEMERAMRLQQKK
jgi:tetratricopeptide (TPR) repeat protein